MNRKGAIAVLTLSILALSGCATMSGDECVTSDWQAIGYEDGLQGYSASRIGSHRKACAKHGVTPDLQAYQDGREQGLQQYCRPSRGFSLGEGGGSYNGVCADHREGDFIDAYNTGHRLYSMRSAVNNSQYQIERKQDQLEKNEQLIRDREATLIAAETSIEDRVLILAELKNMSERIGQLETEIVQLIEDRAVQIQNLAAYEAILADSGY